MQCEENMSFLTMFFRNLIVQCMQWRSFLEYSEVRLIVLLWVCLHLCAHTLEQLHSLLTVGEAKRA